MNTTKVTPTNAAAILGFLLDLSFERPLTPDEVAAARLAKALLALDNRPLYLPVIFPTAPVAERLAPWVAVLGFLALAMTADASGAGAWAFRAAGIVALGLGVMNLPAYMADNGKGVAA